tara:strand:- start:358 stop:849 length:492 start_codon:yes stop_codon:yes gene_type:complete
MRIWLYRGVLVTGLAALSGCAVFDELDKALSPKTEAYVELPADWEGPIAETETASTPEPPRDVVPRPKRKPDILDPKTLVGLDKAAISALFGDPHRITLSQPALVWSWVADGCEMRLFLYPDVGDKTFRALAYEINASQEKNKAVLVDTCASRLKWAHAAAAR